jgi:hypothetical protein
MKKFFHFLLAVIPFMVSAQYPNWGWGPAMTVTMSGSTANLSVYDPFLSMTKTTSVYSVDAWEYDDGVFAWVTPSGAVGGVTYDVNTESFHQTTFTSSSSITIQNRDGVIAYVTSSGAVGGAVYDPVQQSWEHTTFTSSSSITIQNQDGVIAYVTSSGAIGGAVYDPAQQLWEHTTFTSSSSITALNQNGVIGYVTSSGAIGGAIYDMDLQTWKHSTFTSSSSIEMVLSDGVIGYLTSSGAVGGAVYDHFLQSWKHATFTSGSSFTGLTISDGTIFWNSSSGLQNYGYNITSQNWMNGYHTDRSCRYFISDNSGPAPLITYLWCMSIGANSYNHACGDGHSITRRWGWKQYDTPGTYSPELTIYSSTGNSTCTGSVSVTGVDVDDPLSADVELYPNPVSGNGFWVEAQLPLSSVSVSDMLGREILMMPVSGMTAKLDMEGLGLIPGIYLVKIGMAANGSVTRKIVVE